MYLLDSNACIALIKSAPITVRTRFDQEIAKGAAIYVSSIVVFELWYGAAKSARRQVNAHLVGRFLSEHVTLMPFEIEDAKVAGGIRADLEAIGRPIGAYDVLIAGQALRGGLTLVTANVREFSRVKGLDWEDWGK
jgi:tRNA(fMet)-specific endonuclease VapC